MNRTVNMILDFFKESNGTIKQSKTSNAREEKTDKHDHNRIGFSEIPKGMPKLCQWRGLPINLFIVSVLQFFGGFLKQKTLPFWKG